MDFGRILGRDFFEGIFWGNIFWRMFWKDFLGRIYWEEFLARNYLVEIDKELMFLSRFCLNAQGRKEGRKDGSTRI